MAAPNGPALVIAVGKKPGPDDAPPSDDKGGYSDDDAAQEGQEIVSKVQALPPDDLQKLFAGISPEATQVMQKIDCLAPLADFIDNGGNEFAKEPSPADTKTLAAPMPNSPRSAATQAVRENGMPRQAY